MFFHPSSTMFGAMVNRTQVVLLFLLISQFSVAQVSPRKAHRDSMMSYRNIQDTNYVRKYPNRLIITLSNSIKSYDVRFSQSMLTDSLGVSSPRMLAVGRWTSGLSVDFDKISFSFGLNSQTPSDSDVYRMGKTSYKTFSLSVGAYRFRFEGSYRRYQGFYDDNAATTDTIHHRYYQNPSMSVRSLRLKTLFIFNKRKFSYNASFYNTYRQIKPAGSWLLVSNLYNYNFASDSAFVPMAGRPFYGQWENMNAFGITGLSFGPGASYNLVLFRLFYLNLTLTSGIDMMKMQIRADSENKMLTIWKTGYAGDFRAALGMNNRNFYMSVTYRQDYNSYRTNGFRIEPRFHSVDLNIGYRFPFKERKWVTKLKANKWYQLL